MSYSIEKTITIYLDCYKCDSPLRALPIYIDGGRVFSCPNCNYRIIIKEVLGDEQ